MIQGVLFDMDGLMFDTEPISRDGWIEAGREMGVPLDESVVLQLRGTSATHGDDVLRKAFGDSFDCAQAREICTRYLTETLERIGIPLKDGLLELLSYLKEQGIPAALATSTNRERAMDYLRRAGVDKYFSGSVCGDEAGRSKPYPDIFLRAAREIGRDPRDCMVLEDSPNGLRAGLAAGCVTVMVPDLTPPTEEFYASCYRVVPSLRCVPDLIRSFPPHGASSAP